MRLPSLAPGCYLFADSPDARARAGSPSEQQVHGNSGSSTRRGASVVALRLRHSSIRIGVPVMAVMTPQSRVPQGAGRRARSLLPRHERVPRSSQRNACVEYSCTPVDFGSRRTPISRRKELLPPIRVARLRPILERLATK